MARKYVKILGIKIDSTSKDRVIREIIVNIQKGKKFYIVTPNPEQIVLAQKDSQFTKILNRADISLCDGIGIASADKFLKLPKGDNLLKKPILYFAQGLGVGFSTMFDRKWVTKDLPVIRGREIFLELVQLANKKGWKIYLLGGWNKVAERTKMSLEKNFKKVIIKAGTGPMLDDNGTPINHKEEKIESGVVKEINNFKPRILFIGFRAPVQEKWLSRLFKKLDTGGAMVLGGTFNYMAGEAKLPPVWVADMGLEWLWRLITGSQKRERVFQAFPAFPIKVFLQKLKS